MKQTMLSKKNASYLFDHILDGFRSSHEGIEKLYNQKLIDDHELVELLEKNSTRLIERIKEFKFVNQLVSVFFAVLFMYMQTSGDDLEMRRPARARTSSSRTMRSGSRSGRRRSENE